MSVYHHRITVLRKDAAYNMNAGFPNNSPILAKAGGTYDEVREEDDVQGLGGSALLELPTLGQNG